MVILRFFVKFDYAIIPFYVNVEKVAVFTQLWKSGKWLFGFTGQTNKNHPVTGGRQSITPKMEPQSGGRYTTPFWWRELDLNQRPFGYEPNELPGCSIPRYVFIIHQLFG